MELVYTVAKSHRCKRRDFEFRDEKPLISLSARNSLALCTTATLTEDKAEQLSLDTVYHVYVCDIGKPSAVHRIVSFAERVISLQWHNSGLKLLIATSLGNCYVYQMKDYLLNCWEETPRVAHILNEDIVAVSWLQSSGMKTFIADMNDAVLYSEKFVSSKFRPSLSNYGGKAVDGFIAVTASGLAAAALPNPGSDDFLVEKSPLSDIRHARVKVADIAFDADGSILVAASDGQITTPLQCYRVELQRHADGGDACQIGCSAVAGFFLRCHTEPTSLEPAATRVTHMRFVKCDGGFALLVCAGCQSNSHVELWQLGYQSVPLHRFYQPPDAAIPVTVQLQRWSHQSTIYHGSLPTSVAIPYFAVTYATPLTPSSEQPSDASPTPPPPRLFQYIAVAYRDGSVKLIDKQNFRPMTTTNLDTGISDFDDNSKRRRTVAYMTYMHQTVTGCVLIGVDQHSCVYVMRTMNTRDPVTEVSPPYLVSIFEYLLTSGFDFWDLLTAVKSGVIETVQQRLWENFSKQSKEEQSLHYCHLMALSAALARCSINGHARAADCHCQLILHAISNHFYSILRPKILATTEMCPSEQLSLSCTHSVDADINSVVMKLNPEKKFVVEIATLQSMQPLIQWVADLALYLVTLLPATLHGGGTFAGAALLRNARVLATIRELLVVARIWGLISNECLPTFSSTVSGYDVLPQLFRLITRIWLVSHESSTHDFEDSIVDECYSLSAQVLPSPVDDGLFGTVEATTSPFPSVPVKYVFGEAPVSQAGAGTSLFPATVQISAHRRDVIRQMTLGVRPPEPRRLCLRCGCLSLAHQRISSRLQAMRAWELRFERTCICGGFWMLDSAAVDKQ